MFTDNYVNECHFTLWKTQMESVNQQENFLHKPSSLTLWLRGTFVKTLILSFVRTNYFKTFV